MDATQISPYVDLALKVVASVTTAVVMAAPVVIPLWISWRNSSASRTADDRQKAVESDIKRAGLIAASVAADAIRVALEAAAAPNSAGGAVITTDETKTALARGASAGLDYLRRQNLYERAVDVYGSPEAVEASVKSIAHRQVLGDSASIPGAV